VFIFVGGLVIKFISKLIKWSGASGFDRFLGVLFGLSRGLIFLFVIFLLLPSNLKTTDLIVNSKITPLIQKYAPEIEAYFRDLIDNKDIVEEALEIIEPLKDELIPEPNKENTKDGDS
jgi:membrane protein required for colicin V production